MEFEQFRDVLPLILARRSTRDILAFLRTSKSNYLLNNKEFWTKLIRTRWGNVIRDSTIQEYHIRYQQDVDLLVESAAGHKIRVNEQLFNMGVDLDLLIESATNHKLKVIKQLVNRGIDLDARSTNGSTVLIEAVSNSHRVIVKYLLNLGADVNRTNRKDHSPLVIAADKDSGNVIIDLLIKAGADINFKPRGWTTSLAIVLNRNQKEAVETVLKLLQAGADINSTTYLGDTLLTWAAKMNAVDLIRYLLDVYHVDINQRGSGESTALISAVSENNLEAVQTLLKYNPDPTIKDKWGDDALTWAKRYSKYPNQHNTMIYRMIRDYTLVR